MSNTVVSPQSKAIARLLLSVGAVSLSVAEPFTYSSGAKSPIYCDNRLLMSYPKERREVVKVLAELVTSQVGLDEVDVLAGVATSGIPFAAWLAEYMDKPMVYVRDAPKEHGQGRRIEGVLEPQQRAVVVEDLVTTGRSALSTADGLREAGAVVSHSVAIFTYNLDAAAEGFAEANMELLVASNISTLLEEAKDMGSITQQELEEVQSWRSSQNTRP